MRWKINQFDHTFPGRATYFTYVYIPSHPPGEESSENRCLNCCFTVLSGCLAQFGQQITQPITSSKITFHRSNFGTGCISSKEDVFTQSFSKTLNDRVMKCWEFRMVYQSHQVMLLSLAAHLFLRLPCQRTTHVRLDHSLRYSLSMVWPLLKRFQCKTLVQIISCPVRC